MSEREGSSQSMFMGLNLNLHSYVSSQLKEKKIGEIGTAFISGYGKSGWHFINSVKEEAIFFLLRYH